MSSNSFKPPSSHPPTHPPTPPNSLFYDLVLLGFRAALLFPLLLSKSGFVQSMTMLSLAGLYYFYYRGNR